MGITTDQHLHHDSGIQDSERIKTGTTEIQPWTFKTMTCWSVRVLVITDMKKADMLKKKINDSATYA